MSGASRGIGRALANRLAQLGYDLFLLGRDQAKLDVVANECRNPGADVTSLAGDLANDDYIAAAVAAALDRYGKLDVLINNAGGAIAQSVQEADLTAWRDLMSVNFTAAVSLSARVLPSMIARESGAVINISSISGRNTDAGTAIYSASKHALNGLSGSMYEDVRDYGIKVATIMPGFVETDLTARIGLQADNMIRPEDIADCVQYILSASASCCPTEIVLRPQRRLVPKT